MGGGSRAGFLRSGWVGARYVGMGMAAEVLVNDIFAIYWNPAGISELRGQKRLNLSEIKKKARSGKADKISEEDLLNFSEDSSRSAFFQIGMSGAILDVQRNAAFMGIGFDVIKGVMGIACYSVFSVGIQGRDELGNETKDYDYVGAVSYFSYGWSFGVSSIGVSLKVLYELIGDMSYMGVGTDLGAQIYILPFLKVAIVIQDLGTGLHPVEQENGVVQKYDLSYPTLKLGIALSTDAGISLAISGVKKLEQEGFGFRIGIEYEIVKYFAIRIGLNNDSFTTGLTVEYNNWSMSYAFILDTIDYGYNNILSMMLMF
jgi:long-subunit fatty acid transport protein